MKNLLAIVLLLAAGPVLKSQPALEPCGIEKLEKIPFIGGRCHVCQEENCVIVQNGRFFHIVGSEDFFGVGEVFLDGRVKVNWTKISDGMPMYSVLRIREDGSIIGRWGFNWDYRTEDVYGSSGPSGPLDPYTEDEDPRTRQDYSTVVYKP